MQPEATFFYIGYLEYQHFVNKCRSFQVEQGMLLENLIRWFAHHQAQTPWLEVKLVAIDHLIAVLSGNTCRTLPPNALMSSPCSPSQF